MAAMLEHRVLKHFTPKDDVTQALTENLKQGLGCLCDEDFQSMQEVMTKHRDDMKSESTRRARLNGVRPSMAGVVAADRCMDAIDVDDAKLLCPWRGKMTKDTILHWRWKIIYKKRSPPYYVTKTFGGANGVTELEALVHCLRTVWLWETEGWHTVCPYDWDAVLAAGVLPDPVD